MPIYAYRCQQCGHAKDVIQKFSNAPINLCPACGADAFRKQLTAPAFQLKGGGWYVTDFRGGSAGGSSANAGTSASPSTDSAASSGASTEAAPAAASAPATAKAD